MKLAADVVSPALWSAEKPNLYTLLLTLKDKNGAVTETISRKVGFRDVKLLNGRYLVNGMPVLIRFNNRDYKFVKPEEYLLLKSPKGLEIPEEVEEYLYFNNRK